MVGIGSTKRLLTAAMLAVVMVALILAVDTRKAEAISWGDGAQMYYVGQSQTTWNCTSPTITSVTQRMTNFDGNQWYVRQRMAFCYLSTTKAYIKSVTLDYYVPQGKYVRGGTIYLYNNQTIFQGSNWSYVYRPLTSTSSYAGSHTFYVNKWVYVGQSNGRWTTITEARSYFGTPSEWTQGTYSLAQYK